MGPFGVTQNLPYSSRSTKAGADDGRACGALTLSGVCAKVMRRLSACGVVGRSLSGARGVVVVVGQPLLRKLVVLET
jgi:hypothetical protein